MQSNTQPHPVRPSYADPPIPLQLGRPRTARLASAREGRGKKGSGGGGQGYQKPAAPSGVQSSSSTRAARTVILREPSIDPFPMPSLAPPVHLPSGQTSGSGNIARLSVRNTVHSSARIDTVSQTLNATTLGPVRRQRNCGLCGQPGHNRTTCKRQPA